MNEPVNTAENGDDPNAKLAAPGEAAKPVAKVVPPKPTPAKPATAASTTAATKPATAATAAPAAKKPVGPPAKPPAKKGAERRSFLAWLIQPVVVAFAAFTGAVTLMLLGTLRFMIPNVLAEPPSEFKIGSLDQFMADPGTVNERWKNEFGVWIINLAEDKRLIALSTTCTHLGCVPSWLATDRKFKCPCHGSGFYMSGVNFEGPAPRPLERFGISEVDGVVVVNKAKKFQSELGQWDNPESFIKLG